jgi:hypothetical protein
MRLVYKKNGVEVQIGDRPRTERKGSEVEVISFKNPHKPGSGGSVLVREGGLQREYFVGVIGAHWIEREDREGPLL